MRKPVRLIILIQNFEAGTALSPRSGRQAFTALLHGIGKKRIVGIKKSHQFAARRPQTRIQRRCLSAVRFQDQHALAPSKRCQHFPGTIGAAVIHHNHFAIGIGLPQGALNRSLYKARVVEVVDDDGDFHRPFAAVRYVDTRDSSRLKFRVGSQPFRIVPSTLVRSSRNRCCAAISMARSVCEARTIRTTASAKAPPGARPASGAWVAYRSTPGRMFLNVTQQHAQDWASRADADADSVAEPAVKTSSPGIAVS